MEENMSSDSESSFVGLVYQQAIPPLLPLFFLVRHNYCENDCNNKVTSEVNITWYFGRAIQIPIFRVKRHEFEGL